MPIQPGGGRLNWNSNDSIPQVVGNYWLQNYIEGFQMPTMDLTYVLLDGAAANCPLHSTILQQFMTRSNDSIHDVSAIAGAYFFDGSSGFTFSKCKPGAFTLSGAKGDGVNMSASYACYVGNGDALPLAISAAPGAYTPFGGAPIRFQACDFETGVAYTTCLDHVVSWNLSFSNNLTPDMSMLCGPGQQVYPIDVNAGMQTASLRVVFNADVNVPNNHLNDGDSFAVNIHQNGVGSKVICPKIIVHSKNERNIGGGRQMRVYNCTCIGLDNTSGPVLVNAFVP
jgi:hypothetical protein